MHHTLEPLKRDIIICWTQQVNLLTLDVSCTVVVVSLINEFT